MNKTIQMTYNWYENHKAVIDNIWHLILVAFFGTLIHTYKEPENPKKWSYSRFLSSMGVAFLIGVTFLQLNEMYFHFAEIFSMTICVWLGSSSGIIILKFDELLSSFFDSAKTFINNKLQIIVLFIGLSVLATSCKSKPIISTIDNEKSVSTEVVKEKFVNNNLAIIDSLKILIATVKTSKPECDSITNAKIDDLLLQINSNKQSGDNSFGVYYDKLKKQIVAYSKIGATKSEITNDKSTKAEIIKQVTVTKIPVKYIPKWVQFLAFIGAGTIGFGVFKVIKIFYV